MKEMSELLEELVGRSEIQKALIFSGKESTEVPIEFGYRNKMEFSFGDDTRTDRFRWVCTRKAALTTSYYG